MTNVDQEDEPFYANFASNRADLELSERRLRRYQPQAFGVRGLIWSLRRRCNVRWMLSECMKYGDARAAIVWSLHPLRVACYSDEFDAVLMLDFPELVASDQRFWVGQKLVTVNAYSPYAAGRTIAPDIRVGPAAASKQWWNFVPTVAEIFSEDTARIQQLHSRILAREWRRCGDLAHDYTQAYPGRSRNGLPLLASIPATEKFA